MEGEKAVPPAAPVPAGPSVQPEQPEQKPKSKMPLIIGIIAAITLLIAGGCYLIFAPKKQAPITRTQTSAAGQVQAGKTWEIIYANDLFDPAEVTVKKGDTVKFVNQGASPAQIQSDPHPSHTDNPKLNLGSLSVGGSLTVEMNEIGTWGYHNEFNTTQKGKIVVKE